MRNATDAGKTSGMPWQMPQWRGATDPPVSEAQRRAMHAAAAGKSTLGIPQSVGKEFIKEDQAPTMQSPPSATSKQAVFQSPPSVDQTRIMHAPDKGAAWASSQWDQGTSAGAKKAWATRMAGGKQPTKPVSVSKPYERAAEPHIPRESGGLRARPGYLGPGTRWIPPHPRADSGQDQSTGKTREIEAAVRREGNVRDPRAVAVSTRAKMIGWPEVQRKAAEARRKS
jgi:hypothetical protein